MFSKDAPVFVFVYKMLFQARTQLVFAGMCSYAYNPVSTVSAFAFFKNKIEAIFWKECFVKRK